MTAPQPAFEDLISFLPAIDRVSCDDDESESVWGEDAEELVRLSGRFGKTLQDAGLFNQLVCSTSELQELTGPGSDYERSRQDVVALLRQPAGIEQEEAKVAREVGSLFPTAVGYGLLPIEIEAGLCRAEALLGHPDFKSNRPIILRWREQLWRISKRVQSGNLWGKQLILMCTVAFDPEFDSVVNHTLYRSLLLCFRDLKTAARATKSAARELNHGIEEAGNDVMSSRNEQGSGFTTGRQLETAAPAQSSGQVENGPVPPDRFNWGGKTILLGKVSWRLLTELWNSSRRSADVQKVCVAVWGDEEKANRALPSAITRINNAFLKQSIPLEVSRKSGYVSLLGAD